MCVVSVISDYGRNSVPAWQWTTDTWKSYKDVLEKAAEFDKVADQPDCEDPHKTEWMRAIEERITKLESGTGSATVRS